MIGIAIVLIVFSVDSYSYYTAINIITINVDSCINYSCK